MAEGYLNSFNIKGLDVLSRGLSAGTQVSENSVTVMREIGIDISSHTPKTLCRSDLDCDLFFCMGESHKNILLSLGISVEKITVLGGGISDPFGGNENIYRLCRNEITKSIDSLVFGGAFTDFKIYDMQSIDTKAVAEIEKECFSTPWSENALLESMSAGTHFFVAEKDNRILGYGGVSLVCDEGYITNIAVKEEFRNSGVGRLILTRLINFVRNSGGAFISLEVRTSNEKAIGLYKKFGFEAAGERKNFYSTPTENALIMTRRF